MSLADRGSQKAPTVHFAASLLAICADLTQARM